MVLFRYSHAFVDDLWCAMSFNSFMWYMMKNCAHVYLRFDITIFPSLLFHDCQLISCLTSFLCILFVFLFTEFALQTFNFALFFKDKMFSLYSMLNPTFYTHWYQWCYSDQSWIHFFRFQNQEQAALSNMIEFHV